MHDNFAGFSRLRNHVAAISKWYNYLLHRLHQGVQLESNSYIYMI